MKWRKQLWTWEEPMELTQVQQGKHNEKKWVELKGFAEQQQVDQHSHYNSPRRKRKKQKPKKEKNVIENLIDEIMAETFPNLEKKLTSKPRWLESSKYDKLKETDTKMHYN